MKNTEGLRPNHKGSPKLGGRTKGTPNKRSQIAADIMAQHKCDPLVNLLKVVSGDHKPPVIFNRLIKFFDNLAKRDYKADPLAASALQSSIKSEMSKYVDLETYLRTNERLMPYKYPALKAIDVEVDGGLKIEMLTIAVCPKCGHKLTDNDAE